MSCHPKTGSASLLLLVPALLLSLQRNASGEVLPVDSHATGFAALNNCLSSRQQLACQEADTALQDLIQQQGALQRQQHPRCLGALTQLETVLALFRWRLESNGNLERLIRSAEPLCPTASAPISQ